MEGDKLVIVNKNKPVESQLATIAKVLGQIDFSDNYIKPAVRKELEKLWDKIEVTPISDDNDWELS